MHAYVLITVDSNYSTHQVHYDLRGLVTLSVDTPLGTDWNITADIYRTKKAEIEKIHRKIRKIDGVIETAIAFEKPTTQKKQKQ